MYNILTYSISVVVICTTLFMVNPIIAFADDQPIIGDDFVMEITQWHDNVRKVRSEDDNYTYNGKIQITVDLRQLDAAQPGFDVYFLIDRSQFELSDKKIKIYSKGPHTSKVFTYRIPKGQTLHYSGWRDEPGDYPTYTICTFKLVEYDPSIGGGFEDYEGTEELIDYNTYKSCISSNTITAGDMAYGNTEKGSLTTLTWKSLPVNTAGPIYAVCYSQNSGPYYLVGTVDA